MNYTKIIYLCIGGEEDNFTLNSDEVIATCEEYTCLGQKWKRTAEQNEK